MEGALSFNLFGQQISVIVRQGAIYRNGLKRDALWQPDSRRIAISGELPPAERYRNLLHELRHAWTDRMGLPADGESDADDISRFIEAIDDQLDQQGGRSALEALEPVSIAEATPPRPRQTLASYHSSVLCATCGALIAPGSIHNGEAAQHPSIPVFIIDRGTQCPACDTVYVWTEEATVEGVPTGVIFPTPPPRVLRGSERSQWMATHPEPLSVCK